MPTNYELGKRITPPLNNEYIKFINGSNHILIVRETWFHQNDCHEIIPKQYFVERNAQEVRNYLNDHYPFISQIYKSQLEAYLQKEITNHIGKLVIIHLPVPTEFPNKHGTGSGNADDLQKLKEKSQNIQSMTKIDKIILLLTLTFKKMGKNILDSFSMNDLYIIAAILAVWAAAQFFGVGEIIDAALVAWLWWTIGWDCWHFIKVIIKSVSTAISANSIQEIDNAATELAPVAAALGLDAVLGFILHKAKSNPTIAKAAEKEIKTETEFEKVEFGKEAEIPPREVVKGSFTPQGMSEVEADNFMNNNPIGKNMLKEAIKGNPNLSLEQAQAKVLETLRSGSNLPTENILKDGVIYKLQPPEYSSVLPNTPYLITPEHYEQALQMAKQQGTTLDKVLGLPENSVRGDYSVWKLTTDQPATVFTNTIAPTQETVIQKGVEQVIQKPGGAVQDLLLNHNSFQQELMGTINNSPK